MQTYHPFVPHYPPPPIPTRESIITEGLKILEQPKLDQQWVKNWIDTKKQSTSHQITLSAYRQKLIQHAHLLQQYQQASTHASLEELQSRIEQSSVVIYDANIIKTIQTKLRRRKSKRARLRRQKEHKPVDPITEQPTNEKPLPEKIQEIQSILQTIEKLQQIKNTDDLTEVHKLCTTKLVEYQTEMNHVPLCNYLFNNNDQSFYESINPDAQYFLRAHQNVNNLVQIRQAWDQYSRPSTSSSDSIIPLAWHELQLPCDTNWAQYIFIRNQ